MDSPELQRLTAELTAVGTKNNWDSYRIKPGIGTYSLAGLLFILPKVGALKMASVKGPDVDTDREYMKSVLNSTELLNSTLRRFTPPPATRSSASSAATADTNSQPPPTDPLPAKPGSAQAVPRGSSDPRHPLQNRDLDTGFVVKPSGYPLTDSTYCSLVHRLAAKPTQPIPPGIKEDILAYYADMNLPFATKAKLRSWQTLQTDLATLRGMPTSDEPLPYPTYGPDSDSTENSTNSTR